MTDKCALMTRARLQHEKTPILAQVPAAKADGKVASMRLYDRIDSWGEDWGVSAKEFAAALDDLGDDVEEIQLSINSPGGEVFEGIAILNTLRRHDARVVVTVDGLAASAASFVAMAGAEVIMARNSEMMIHKAWGLVMGNADDMQDMVSRLEKDDRNIASIYAERAGGTVEDWLDLMSDETWFSAEEAVEAGLADRVEESKDASEAKNRIDTSIFNHAGRADAPAPKFPAKPKQQVAKGVPPADAMARIHNASLRGTATPKEGDMQFTDEQMSELRTKLGITDDKELEPAMVLAALGEPAPQNGSDPSGAPAPKPDGDGPSPTPAVKNVAGTVTVDQAAWDQREDRIKRLEAADQRRRQDERDQVIDQAVQDGKFPPNRKDHWKRLWDADSEGTRQALDGLAKNVINVEALGYANANDEALDDEFKHLFPPEQKKGA